MKAVCLVLAVISAGHCAQAARIGLDPLMGDGAIGRNTSISGVNFEPSTSYTVLVAGLAVVPATVSSDAAGAIPATPIELPALPGGNLDVTLSSASRVRTFTGAFHVWPNICLAPTQGNGMAGATWQTGAGIPTGGWKGMVFTIEGTGFNSGAVIAANSITVGAAATTHAQINVDASGRLGSTTVIIASNLPGGYKDVVINDGRVRTYANAYTVNRVIGLNPARGRRTAGSPITVMGWGFTRTGTIAANSILVAGGTTTHPAAAVANGYFSVNLTVDAGLGNNASNAVTISDGVSTNFPGAFYSVGAGSGYLALIPVRFSGIANEVFLIQGIAGTNNNIPANSITLNENNPVRSATTHPLITVAAGTFPTATVMVNSAIPWGVNRVETGFHRLQSIQALRSLDICPVVTSGYAGWTLTITGYGFNQGNAPAANTTTVGGIATTHPAVVIGNTGDFRIPVTVAQPQPFGGKDVTIDDSVAGTITFPIAVQADRTIGLSSYVVGPGAAADTIRISGTGFTASANLAANSIMLGAYSTTHPIITVGANGSFGPTAITLPVMGSGPYDLVTTQETFPASYRVYNPVAEVTKFRDPGRGVSSEVVTFSFSFTNAQYVGDPSARSFVLMDSLPAGLKYVGASSTCYPPAVTSWYYGGAWQATEPVPASNASGIRWTLANPLLAGDSGWAKFQMTVP